MSLWNSGLWDAAKWSTIEATVSVALDDITFAAAGKDVHVGVISVALDDITVTSSGKITHNAVVDIGLADLNVSANGNITRHADIQIDLEDLSINFIGKLVHVDDFNVTLGDIRFSAEGSVQPPSIQLTTKGGYPKKKIKRERDEVENVVKKAVNKSLGIVEPEDIVEQVEETKQPEIDYTAQINDMMLRMQAEALGLSIEQYLIESELDDEEAILLFL